MTWPTLLQASPADKTRLGRPDRRQRLERIVRRACRRAVCQCAESRRNPASASNSSPHSD